MATLAERIAQAQQAPRLVPGTRAYIENAIAAGIAPYTTGEGETATNGPEAVAQARYALQLLDQYGVNSITELPPELQKIFAQQGSNSFIGQIGDFVTNPAFLTLAGGAAGVGLFGGGAAAGAASTPAAGTAGPSRAPTDASR
mgnify:CR=1 FL=1